MLLIVADKLKSLIAMNDMINLKAEGDRTRREDKAKQAARILEFERELQDLRAEHERAKREHEESIKQAKEEIRRWKSENAGNTWQVCIFVLSYATTDIMILL